MSCQLGAQAMTIQSGAESDKPAVNYSDKLRGENRGASEKLIRFAVSSGRLQSCAADAGSTAGTAPCSRHAVCSRAGLEAASAYLTPVFLGGGAQVSGSRTASAEGVTVNPDLARNALTAIQ